MVIGQDYISGIRAFYERQAMLIGLLQELVIKIDELNKKLPLCFPRQPQPTVTEEQPMPSVFMLNAVPFSVIQVILANSQRAIVPEFSRQAITVSPNSETTLLCPTKQGYNMLFTEPVQVSSSFHDPGLHMVYIVNRERRVERGPYPLSKDLDFDIRMFQHVDGFSPEYIQFKFVNNTTTATIITLDIKGFFIEKSLFTESILPLLQSSSDDFIQYGKIVRMR